MLSLGEGEVLEEGGEVVGGGAGVEGGVEGGKGPVGLPHLVDVIVAPQFLVGVGVVLGGLSLIGVVGLVQLVGSREVECGAQQSKPPLNMLHKHPLLLSI